MITLLEPFSILIIDGNALKVERVDGNVFGGFCRCGGIMVQKAWIEERILISECEKCWRVEALIFNGRKLVDRLEVKVIYRQNIDEFLRDLLSPAELEAIYRKARNSTYNYNAFSRAKRKLEELKIDVNEIIGLLR